MDTETIAGIFLFVGAIWLGVMLIMGYLASRKRKDKELEQMFHFTKNIEEIQHQHMYQIDECAGLLRTFTIDEMRELSGLKPFPTQKEKPMLNCPNCGAPITGGKCEYCGTVFRDREEDAEILYADNRPILTLKMDTKQLCDRISTEEMNANLIRALHSDQY